MPNKNDSLKNTNTSSSSSSLLGRIWNSIKSTLVSFQSLIRSLFKRKNDVEQSQSPSQVSPPSSELSFSISQENKDVVKGDGLLLAQQQRKLAYEKLKEQSKKDAEAAEVLVNRQKEKLEPQAEIIAQPEKTTLNKQIEQEIEKANAYLATHKKLPVEDKAKIETAISQLYVDLEAYQPTAKESEKILEKLEKRRATLNALIAPEISKVAEPKVEADSVIVELPKIVTPVVTPVKISEEEGLAKKFKALFDEADNLTIPVVIWASLYQHCIQPCVSDAIKNGRAAISKVRGIVEDNKSLLSATIQGSLETYLKSLASSIVGLQKDQRGFLVVAYDLRNLNKVSAIIQTLSDAKSAIERAKEITVQSPSTTVDEQVASIEKKMQEIAKEQNPMIIDDPLIGELKSLRISLTASLDKIAADNPEKFRPKSKF